MNIWKDTTLKEILAKREEAIKIEAAEHEERLKKNALYNAR